jgi:hypothetical protein
MTPEGLRFVFHIGAGKTGTSSIQFTLRHGAEALKRHGAWYLGLIHEHAPARLFPWQVAGGVDQFHQLDQETGEAQLDQVLARTVDWAREEGLHTLVWSSESFFDRHAKAIPPLQRLASQGVDVRIVAYVRRHDSWARSAYAQWAIKHKTNLGPVLPFGDWVARRKPLFAPTVATFEAAFPGRVQVRNLDAAGDAVADFLDITGLGGVPLHFIRENVTPDDTELLMRALFNDGIKEKAFPMLFDRVLGRHTRFDMTPVEMLEHLMPTAEQLAQVHADCAPDRAFLDAFLERQAQAPLSDRPASPKAVVVDESRLLFALARLAVFQMRRIENLEGRLRRIEAAEDLAE